MGTFDVCILESITKNKDDEDLNTTRDAVTAPYTLIPENNTDHHGTILTKLIRDEGQSCEMQSRTQATDSGGGENGTQVKKNRTHRTVRII